MFAAEGGADEASDPYDAVQVRPDVLFVNLPLTSRERESITLVWSATTGRAVAAHSVIQATATDDVPQVTQSFWSGAVDGRRAHR